MIYVMTATMYQALKYLDVNGRALRTPLTHQGIIIYVNSAWGIPVTDVIIK